jgi:hypothetical protein
VNDAPRYTTRVPAGRPVVVEPDSPRIHRRYGKLLAVGLVMLGLWIAAAAIASADGMDKVGMPTFIAWLLGAVVVVCAVVFIVQRWRAESRGPILVGDEIGIWMRMGGSLKLRGLFLPWESVQSVELVEYRRSVVLCIRSELGEAAVRQRSDDLLMEVRRRRRWSDSSFAIHPAFTRAALPEVRNRLLGLAGSRLPGGRPAHQPQQAAWQPPAALRATEQSPSAPGTGEDG